MIPSIAGQLIALAAALIALGGNTWNARAKGWRRLTGTGRIAALLAALGFLLSLTTTYQSYQEQRARREAAVAEIDRAWHALATPFRLLTWALEGSQPSPSAAMVEKFSDADVHARVATIDLRDQAPHHHGPWLEVICRSAVLGMENLRTAQTIYVGIVEAELIVAMKDVATDHMLASMASVSPCGGWDVPRDGPISLESITNFRELPRYVSTLVRLKRQLDQ